MYEDETPYVTARYCVHLKDGDIIFGYEEQIEPDLPCTFPEFIAATLTEMMDVIVDQDWFVIEDGVLETAVLVPTNTIAKVTVDVFDGEHLFVPTGTPDSDGDYSDEPPF